MANKLLLRSRPTIFLFSHSFFCFPKVNLVHRLLKTVQARIFNHDIHIFNELLYRRIENQSDCSYSFIS